MSEQIFGEKTVEPMIFAEDHPTESVGCAGTWKILVVDDDREVHRMTKFVLERKKLVGRPLELLFASNTGEAEQLLADNEIACTLLDVVMEKEDSGLKLVKKIRDSMGNPRIRIILRTGQPGMAPEHAIIEQYEINDYREKTELTAQKLITAVTSAIRAYRDIEIIDKSKRSLRMIIDSSSNIFGFQPYKKFADKALHLIESLLEVKSDAVFALAADSEGEKSEKAFTAIAATGRFVPFVDRDIQNVLEEKEIHLIRAALSSKKTIYGDIGFAMEIDSGKNTQSVLYVKYDASDNPFERELLDVSCSNIKSAYTNLSLYNEVQKLAHERGVLLREVHHRVKNNLQVISSLIDFEISDRTSNAEKRLLNIRNRIQSIAAVHDCVHDTENIDTVDFGDVAQSVMDIVSGNEPGRKSIHCETRFESVRITLDKAIPCSLILGELAMNALRHALNSLEGKHVVIHTGAANNKLLMEIRAGSAGGEEANDLAKKDSVSDMIVQALVTQLDGDYRFSVSEGMAVDFSMPM